MAGMESPATGAEILVWRLRDLGVTHIFGYPGGQITPIYDALYRDGSIRHVLARDEQAAAFMADGYARATGRPGVTLAVCGPGVLNAATPLATSFTDSIPVLLLSGQVPAASCGLRTGYYHENEQLQACATFTKWQARAQTVEAIVPELDRAYTVTQDGRPGPAIFEVPLDVLRTACAGKFTAPAPPDTMPHQARSKNVAELAALLAAWKKPLIIVGGGVLLSGAEMLLLELAERLGAPVFHTLSGKSAFPGDHPLLAGLPWTQATSDLTNMGSFMSPLFAEADGLLAIGCRFSQACTGSWSLKPPPSLAQIDIDPDELGRHYPLTLGVQGDARDALRMALGFLSKSVRQPWTKTVRRPPPRLAGLDLITPLRRALPRNAIIAADITRLSYMMLADFPVYEPKTFLHPAGFVSMGFGLPAAIGAKAAFRERTVVAIAGDGCFMMSGMELATAVQEKLPVIVIVVNDGSLTLIKAIQQRRYEGRFLGVDLKNPDFGLFAKAFGVRAWQVDTEATFEKAVTEAVALAETCLIEVRLPT